MLIAPLCITNQYGISRNGEQSNASEPRNLFMTRYCGIGGAGTPVNSIDSACQRHDACYTKGHITAGSNLNPFPGGHELDKLRNCNNALYSDAVIAAKAGVYGGEEIFDYFYFVPFRARCFR